MAKEYNDVDCYLFHEKDSPEACFLCRGENIRVLIVRHEASMMLVHLCEKCFVRHLADFYLDNTRPWFGPR